MGDVANGGPPFVTPTFPIGPRPSPGWKSNRQAQRLQRAQIAVGSVIRPSGTEPVIRVMAEGDDLGQVERVVDRICDAVRKAAA